MTYKIDQVMELAKGGAESNREALEPDGDWMPVLIGLQEEDAMIIGFPLPGDQQEKEQIVQVLAVLARQQGFQAMAIVTTIWSVIVDSNQLSDEEKQQMLDGHLTVRPSEHPARREAVLIQGLDPEVMRFEIAWITRHEDGPPTLSEWEAWGEDGGAEVTGLFPDTLRGALR